MAHGTFAACMENARYLAAELSQALCVNDDAIFDYDREPEEIEHRGYDGFIPWTSGGFEIVHCASLDSARGSGRIPTPIQPIIDSLEKDCADDWARLRPDAPALWDCFSDEKWEIEAQRHEEMWFCDSDSVYYWKARVMFLDCDDRQNETGKPEVYIDAYICTDSYGRDNIPWLRCYGANPNQTAGEFKLTIPASRFAAMDSSALDLIVKEAVEALP